jgi:site-specific recombinase XerD
VTTRGRRAIATATSSASLERGRAGRWRVVDARRRPIREANRFLASAVVRGLSQATVRAYGFDLVVLYRWLAARRLTLRGLSEDELLEFVAMQKRARAQPRSINRRLTTVRQLYRFCIGHELSAGFGSPSYYRGAGRDRELGLHQRTRRSRLRLRVKVPRRIVEPLSRSEVRGFLRSLRRYRDLAIVHLMLLCGLRSAEVLGLGLGDVQFEDAQLRIRGKGQRDRVLPLPELAARLVHDYLHWERPAESATQRLFVVMQGRRRGHAMTLAGLRSLFRHRRRVRAFGRANPHRFRHTFGADMARAGVRLPILQRMMGHADASTTLQYIHLSMADIADEYQRAVEELRRRYTGRG